MSSLPFVQVEWAFFISIASSIFHSVGFMVEASVIISSKVDIVFYPSVVLALSFNNLIY